MPYDTFAKIKGWKTLELVILRNLLHREIHRRMDCAKIGKPHTEEEIRAFDEKTEAFKARQRGDMERSAVAMVTTDQNALDEAQKPKEGPR